MPGLGLLYGTFNEPEQSLSAIVAEAPHRQTNSLLSLKSIEKPLRCGSTVPIVVKYTLVGETPNGSSLHIYYLVSYLLKAQYVLSNITKVMLNL